MRLCTFGQDSRTVYYYDDRNNLIRKVEGIEAGGTLNQTYTQTTYEYDQMDRLTRVALPDGTAREYTYDVATRRGASTTVAAGGVKTHELHAYGPSWETLGCTWSVLMLVFHLRQPTLEETKR